MRVCDSCSDMGPCFDHEVCPSSTGLDTGEMNMETSMPPAPHPSTSMKAERDQCWRLLQIGWYLACMIATFRFSASHIYKPRLPEYDVQNFHIAGLATNVGSSAGVWEPFLSVWKSTLTVDMAFEILSRNPNAKHDFDYDTLNVHVRAGELTLGSGAIAGFRQGRNTTAIPVAFKTAVLANDYAVSAKNGLDLSNLELVIKVDTQGQYKSKSRLVSDSNQSRFWMSIRCWALVDATPSDGAPAVVKNSDCGTRKRLDRHAYGN